MYVVGFNGPPQSGKDTLAQMLVDHMLQQRVEFAKIKQESLSMPLRHIAYAMTGYGGLYEGYNYEQFKNTFFPEFNRTGRELMIDISERFLKPVYGSMIMAKLLMGRNENHFGVLLVRDCGFQLEVDPIIAALGDSKRFYLVNVMRAEKNFGNDSREWVNHPISTCQMQVNNSGSLDDLRVEAGRIYGRLVNQMGWTL